MNNNQGYYNNQNYNYNNYQQQQYSNQYSQQPQQNTQAKQQTGSMSFGKSVSSFWKNYGNFNGTASRSEFWKWFAVEYVIDIIAMYFAFKSKSNISLPKPATILGAFGISTIWWLAIVVPNWALRMRRFRDAGMKKGLMWTLLICDDVAEFVPVIGPAIFYLSRLMTIYFECVPSTQKAITQRPQQNNYQTQNYRSYPQQNQQNYGYQQNNYNQYRR